MQDENAFRERPPVDSPASETVIATSIGLTTFGGRDGAIDGGAA